MKVNWPFEIIDESCVLWNRYLDIKISIEIYTADFRAQNSVVRSWNIVIKSESADWKKKSRFYVYRLTFAVFNMWLVPLRGIIRLLNRFLGCGLFFYIEMLWSYESDAYP